MIELFNYIRKLQTSSFVWLHKAIMQCYINVEVHQYFISWKKLQYQSTVKIKY